MFITYDILIGFNDGTFLSAVPQIEMDVSSVDELTLEDHTQVCCDLLNHYCNQKRQMGELICFGCEGNELTDQVKALLIPHSQ